MSLTNEPWFWRVYIAALLVAAFVCRVIDWQPPKWLFWPTWVIAMVLMINNVRRCKRELGR